MESPPHTHTRDVGRASRMDGVSGWWRLQTAAAAAPQRCCMARRSTCGVGQVWNRRETEAQSILKVSSVPWTHQFGRCFEHCVNACICPVYWGLCTAGVISRLVGAYLVCCNVQKAWVLKLNNSVLEVSPLWSHKELWHNLWQHCQPGVIQLLHVFAPLSNVEGKTKSVLFRWQNWTWDSNVEWKWNIWHGCNVGPLTLLNNHLLYFV